MNKFAVGLVLAGVLLPASSQAQVMIDKTRVSCADYLAMAPGRIEAVSAWMSEWFNQKTGYTTVDLRSLCAESVAKREAMVRVQSEGIRDGRPRTLRW